MSKRTARGEKRKCQNADCTVLFYDLNRKEFGCPICETTFDLELHAAALAKQREDVPDYIRRRHARELPVVANTNAAADGANDNKVDKNDEHGDGDVVPENETAAAEAADALIEADEDAQDPLAYAFPLAVADYEKH